MSQRQRPTGAVSSAITQGEAERLVETPRKNGINGSFVLRPSANVKGAYGLAVTYKSAVKHYRITQFPSKKYGIQDGLRFVTLDLMVAHYFNDRDGLVCTLTQNMADMDESSKLFVGKMTMSGQALIPLFHLEVGQVLGKGEFGEVKEGFWKSEQIPVAIKYLKKTDEDSKKEFEKEAVRLAAFDHKYVNKMHGICIEDGLALVMELVPLGALNKYLKKKRGLIPIPQLEEFIHQIAQGMDYLGQHRVLHRDLAARNILVKAENHVQIADFGLSRVIDDQEDIYSAQTKGKWPIKWYALECMLHRTFSFKSDVWSFGVTAWEIMTFGMKPYGKLKGHQIVEMLSRHVRLQQPDDCCDELYSLMTRTWKEDPKERPTFKEAADEMQRVRDRHRLSGYEKHTLRNRNTAITNQDLYDTLPDLDEIHVADEEDRNHVKDAVGSNNSLFASSSVFFDYNDISSANSQSQTFAGTFGQVVKATTTSKAVVAEKWIERSATFNAVKFQKTMEHLRVLKPCQHLIQFYGISQHPTKTILIISEWAGLGSLSKFLKSRKIPPATKLMFCTQIAAAMKFMESKSIVHRNLAARNVLVVNANEVKVGDYGVCEALCLGSDFYRSADKCRMKWQPIDAFVDGVWTTKSDVWSFGVTMWEIFADGATPYGSQTGKQVMKSLVANERLTLPLVLQVHPVGELVTNCWEEAADFRPSFLDLHHSLSTSKM